MKQPETKLKELVMRDLKEVPNCWFVKVQQMCIRGTPDMLLCVSGSFVAIELKKDDKSVVTPIQKYELAKIRAAGGHSFVVTPENWDKVKTLLYSLADSSLKVV